MNLVLFFHLRGVQHRAEIRCSTGAQCLQLWLVLESGLLSLYRFHQWELTLDIIGQVSSNKFARVTVLQPSLCDFQLMGFVRKNLQTISPIFHPDFLTVEKFRYPSHCPNRKKKHIFFYNMCGSLVYTHWDSFSSVTHRMHYAGTFIDCVGTLVLCHRSTHCAWTLQTVLGLP